MSERQANKAPEDEVAYEPPGSRNHEQREEQSPQALALTRRVSTPARINFGQQPETQTECQLPTGNENRMPVKRNHRLRHSFSALSQQQNRRHHQHPHHNQHQNNAASSSSSASSSASDSAFSQSQTTLELDTPEQLSNFRFRRSFDTNHLQLLRRLKKSKSADGEAPSEQGDNLSDGSQQLMVGDHFKITWRNLSYQVPDKRFARITSYLNRKREAIWTRSEEQQPVADEPLSADEAPMRPPTTGKPRKVIFSGLNGCVRSGQLTAILGPSGAGKTTFLKCLTNSLVKGVSGSIDITGSVATSHLKLCIIPQKDYLFDNLTVMENLIFASRIKNIQSNFNHAANVERVANLLGLQQCLKLKTNKLSGGQYKRVSIAQELLSKPDILILDEPTSGLDSLTCFRTVSVLRDLVNLSSAGLMPPLAIIMTIHQPQIKIFNLFHHVYILSSMGKCVFEGRPEYLVDTVADCCKLLPPADDLNPASFIIDIASGVYGTKPMDQLISLQHENFLLLNSTLSVTDIVKPLEQNGGNSTSNNNNLSKISLCLVDQSSNKMVSQSANGLELDKERGSEEDNSGKGDKDEFRISDRLIRRHNHDSSFWLHTGLLIKRLWMSTWRDPLLTTTRITFHLIIPFVFYFIYSQKSGMANACPHVEREFNFQTMTSEANIHRLETQHNELILTFENVSLFFLLLYSFSMCVLAVTALSFPLNMQILLKETSNGWYSMPRFVMAKTLADLPIELAMPMISVSIAYVLTGQPSSYLSWRMLTVTAVMTLCSLISQTQGLLFGAYFMNNVQAAVFVSQASSLPWIMLSGFTTRVSELPVVLQWLSFGSIYRLGIESIVSVRYGFGMCPCDQELVNDRPPKLVGIPDQMRSLMNYYLDMYSETPTTTNSTGDIFENIANTLSRANTYGVNVVSCHDVRPFIMSAREVDERTLPTFIMILLLIFVGLKILLFCIVRLRAV